MLAKGFGDKVKPKTSSSTSPATSVAPGSVTAPPKRSTNKGGPWKVTEPRNEAFEKALKTMEETHDSSNNLATYINPELLADPATLQHIGEELRAGNVVVIRNALDPTLAETTHRDLRADSAPWEHHENYFEDGYHFKHSNIFNREKWTARLNKTMAIFESDATKAWMSQLTGRDCSGETTGAPSLYRAGDHSLPHTDWAGQRTVAYVWHLSKDWRPEWGGGLYWCSLPHAKATQHASFNTLVLFSATTRSSHFVTTVSPHATSKRLTFNGWYQSSWIPKASDDFESRLATAEDRLQLTFTQLQTISDLVSDRFARFESPQKRELLAARKDLIMKEFFPSKSW